MMKGQVEEAKRVLCCAAKENKKNIPLTLLGKVKVLGPRVEGSRGMEGPLPSSSSQVGSQPRGVPSPQLEGNGDCTVRSCQGKTRDQAAPWGKGGLVGPAGWEHGGSLPASGWSCLPCSYMYLERR